MNKSVKEHAVVVEQQPSVLSASGTAHLDPSAAEHRREYVSREGIMKLLSDDEVARVSTAETGARLDEGEEYLDLEHLDQGVRRAKLGTTMPMGRALPKSAVRESTWVQILTWLTPAP
jgi:hypothetical protein